MVSSFYSHCGSDIPFIKLLSKMLYYELGKADDKINSRRGEDLCHLSATASYRYVRTMYGPEGGHGSVKSTPPTVGLLCVVCEMDGPRSPVCVFL